MREKASNVQITINKINSLQPHEQLSEAVLAEDPGG